MGLHNEMIKKYIHKQTNFQVSVYRILPQEKINWQIECGPKSKKDVCRYLCKFMGEQSVERSAGGC
jgi:hypothetical protein